MANLFLHKSPTPNGVKFTIICTNDMADAIDQFLGTCFEMEVMATGTKIKLRSETRFEFEVEDPIKIESLTRTLRSSGKKEEVDRNYPLELLENLCMN